MRQTSPYYTKLQNFINRSLVLKKDVQRSEETEKRSWKEYFGGSENDRERKRDAHDVKKGSVSDGMHLPNGKCDETPNL